MVAISSDPRPIVASLPSTYTWESWRLRFLSYGLGSMEFATNAFINVREALNRASQDELDPLTFEGKVCIVTGANAGIGLATAAELVARGAHVIMACRSMDRAKPALKEVSSVEARPGCSKGSAELAELDLSSLASVRKFIASFNDKRQHLDLLICNAGIMAPLDCQCTVDGVEAQFQVNYLGHWLIAHDVLIHQRQMRKSESVRPKNGHAAGQGTRVVFLSSLAHIAGLLKFGPNDELNLTENYSGYGAYGNSKLAAILAAKEFQRRIDRNERVGGVEDVAVSVHPGLIDTHLSRNWIQEGDVLGRFMRPLVNLTMRPLLSWVLLPVSHGVRSVLFAAGAPAEQVKGAYVSDARVAQPVRMACDPAFARSLWNASCKLTGVEASPTLE